MATEIRTIVKPQIYLIGNIITNSLRSRNFSERVDYAKDVTATSTNVITGVSQFDSDNILTFENEVRIIITTQVSEEQRPNIRNRQNSLEYSGIPSISQADTFNQYAYTYYSLNGRDPKIRNSYLYMYDDMWDRIEDPSAGIDNINTLGFVLKNNPTGSELITLKAKTFYAGNSSFIAKAVFKIAISNQKKIDNAGNNGDNPT